MMRCDRVVFSGHAVRRMFERRINREEADFRTRRPR